MASYTEESVCSFRWARKQLSMSAYSTADREAAIPLALSLSFPFVVASTRR